MKMPHKQYDFQFKYKAKEIADKSYKEQIALCNQSLR